MKMKRLIILVEGDSEIILMKKLVIPYLYDQISGCLSDDAGWSFETQKITTNRKLNKKGGNISYIYLLNEIKRITAQGCTLITTFFDFFRLPVDFPSHTMEGSRIETIEAALMQALKKDVMHLPAFIPYIQMYEFEALLFSGMDGFELVVDEANQLGEIQAIMDQYPNPEEINGGASTAPSKRLKKIYNYDKTGDSELILELLGLDAICEKCPRFKSWLNNLLNEIIGLTFV